MRLYLGMFWLVIFVGFLSSALAADYQTAGVVNQVNQEDGRNTVIIDYVEYQLNAQVKPHTPVRFGEQGPLLTAGMRVGINSRVGEKGESVITDIWVLVDE